MLTPITEDGGVHAAECTLRNLFGVTMTSRMTVLRLDGGGLLLHSPVRLTPALKAGIDALGTVAWIVAPNRFHHMFVADHVAAWPEARLAGAPGLPAKRADLAFDRELRPQEGPGPIPDRDLDMVSAADPEWGTAIAWEPIGGSRAMGEVAFLHRPSRSLLLTDFLLNPAAGSAPGLRFWAWLNGVRGSLGMARLVRVTYRDRAAARASLDRILGWDFDRLIPCHGPVVETGAKALVGRATGWLR